MYDSGYQSIWNMDISTVCIDQMRARNKDRPSLKWDVMDCRNLQYPQESFDLVIDKSTIDALLCGNSAYMNVALLLKEGQRVVKTGGYYVAISYGLPENREVHFLREHLNFELRTYMIKKENKDSTPPSIHHIYVCKKLPGADQKAEECWPGVVKEIKLEMEREGGEVDSTGEDQKKSND